MACESIISYTKDCNSKPGGVKNLWLLNYTDLTSYTTGTSGDVTALVLAADAEFKKVGLIKNTSGLTQTFTKTIETGTAEIATEFVFVITKISSTSRNFLDKLMNAGEVVAIAELRSGVKVIFGLTGGIELTSLVYGSGTAAADLNGATVTLTGSEDELARILDATVVI